MKNTCIVEMSSMLVQILMFDRNSQTDPDMTKFSFITRWSLRTHTASVKGATQRFLSLFSAVSNSFVLLFAFYSLA